ncbi:MAG: DUF4097 domain-containing protein [Candidatus Sabulitectum sp.]|nr:DUF4097 domain-containing protein [Candidatus Sabulitectum sp.]
MSEEKEKVLEMVADGTITASEGARLLEALGSEGFIEKKQKAARKRRITKTRTMISEIGPMIQATMGDVFKGRKSFHSYENMAFEEVESVSEEVEDQQELVLYGEGGRGKSLSITLSRSEDDFLRASLDNDSPIKTGRKNDKRILLWTSGELSVQVPDNLSFVKVFSKGGGISSSDVRVPVELKTMGGGIDISNPGDSFSIKTMGGGLDISLDSTWKGDSKAKTMGGGISIHLTDDVSALINASTLGGSISVGGNDPEIISDSGRDYGKSKISVRYGSDENLHKLSVISMGGGIVIEGESDE